MTIEELFGTLQQSIVAEWRKHLKTSKYSKHMALDEFYKEMPELVDTLIEDYNGHVGKKVEDFKNILDAEKLDALQYLEELHKICQDGYDLLPEDAPELKSDLDAIKSKIDSVMYKVRELTEKYVMKSLKDFLCESLVNEEASSKIREICSKLKLNYDVDPLDYYVYMQDELEEDSSKSEIDKWIDSEIEQIIIDIHNVDKAVSTFNNSKDYKQFVKLFTKEYKNQPYYNIGLTLYEKLLNAQD